MKAYRTEIVIDRSCDRVWQVLTDFASYPEWNPLVKWCRGDFARDGKIEMWIVPLNRSFQAHIDCWEVGKEFSWIGTQGAAWLIAGEHYYRLESLGAERTRLIHGERFRGIASNFIGTSLLTKMETTFCEHNQRLKERVERG